MRQTKTAYAVRVWRWKPNADRSADLDPLETQEEVFEIFPTRSAAETAGKKLASDPRNTNPDTYELLRGTPDPYAWDGWEWSPLFPSVHRP